MKNKSLRPDSVASPLRMLTIAFAGISSITMSDSVTAETSHEMEAVTVIGNKMSRNIKDTTTAVTVITEDDLNNGEPQDIDKLATEAPNVITAEQGAISIRGLKSSGAATGGYALLTGARSRVSTIVDGTAQDWSGYNFTPSRVWDVQQVEILRGPQSSTQGSSAMGGALVIKTNDPVFEQESKVRLGLERYKNKNIKPNLAVMNSGAIIDDELAYRIAIDGTKGDGWMNYAQADNELDTGPDVDDSENLNVRGKLLWEPEHMPQFSAKLTVEHHKYEGEYLSWANDVSTGYTTQTQTLDDENGKNTRLQDSKVNLIAVDGNYEFTPGVTNSLHLSYLDSEIHFDEYPGDTVVNIEKETFTVENRIIFDQDDTDLTGVVGIFASHKDNDIDYEGVLFNTGTTKTTAVYGEGIYALTDQVNLIAGTRIENEDVNRTSGYNYDSSRIPQNFDKTYFLPKLGMTYDVTQSTTLNLSVRQGYSPGGTAFTWDGNRDIYTYDSEEVTTYEMGSKSLFSHDITLYTSIFYNDYSDYQAFIDTTYIDNVDSAHTYGIEAEGTGWATDQLELHGSIGLLRSKIDSYKTYVGNDLPGAPELNLAAGFVQHIGDHWSAGVDVSYVGEYYSDLDNTDDRKAGDYVKTDARIRYTHHDLQIDLYVNNLTDEDIIYSKSRDSAYVGQTRTIGLGVTYSM